MQEKEHSEVQGLLTLNYDSVEDISKKEETTHAAQLSSGGGNTVVLLELNQEKGVVDSTHGINQERGVMGNAHESKSVARYKIGADKLISLIKEHGEVIRED